jgi:hypothetical protein
MFNTTSIALLLVGEMFRNRGHVPCVPSNESIRDQLEICMAYITNIVMPLEKEGATVKVFLTMSKCNRHLDSRLKRCYQRNLVRSVKIVSMNIANGWIQSWRHFHTSPDFKRYDYVLQTRNDVFVDFPITKWPSNFSQFLFEQQCYLIHEGCECPMHNRTVIFRPSKQSISTLCVRDKMLWIPKKYAKYMLSLLTHAPQHELGHLIVATFYRKFGFNDAGFMFPGGRDNEPKYLKFHYRRDRIQNN